MERLFELLNSDSENNRLIVMPLTRLLFHRPFSIGKYHFYPQGEFDVASLRPIPNKTLENEIFLGAVSLKGQVLRESATSLTGFDLSVLENNPLVVFIEKMNWHEFLSSVSHDYDIDLIKYYSSKAEKALDIIRFDFCRLDLPDTLPGLIGSWSGSADYLGAMFYTPEDHESYLIAGSAVECSVVIKGLGLEIDFPPSTPMPVPETGEVASVASHSLSLLTEAMISPNETIKFMRVMTLLEFLASNDQFQNWKKLKGDIICHTAKDKSEYLDLIERFKYLTSIAEDGVQSGLRTLIIHQGKLLPDLITSHKDRRALFLELQRYAGCAIDDMIKNQTLSWEEYKNRRASLKTELGVA